MTTRILQFFGLGYGETPATITVSRNGTAIFSGEVTTSPTYTGLEDKVILYTDEIAIDFSGTIPYSISVTNGMAVFGMVLANYSALPNPIFTTTEIGILSDINTPQSERVALWTSKANPALSPAEITILETGSRPDIQQVLLAHNIAMQTTGADGFIYSSYRDPDGTTDNRSNVTIDGVPYSPPSPRPDNMKGSWVYQIHAGSTFTYDLHVLPAIE